MTEIEALQERIRQALQTGHGKDAVLMDCSALLATLQLGKPRLPAASDHSQLPDELGY